MVLPSDAPRTPVIETAPLLCIEALSPDDRLNEIMERAADYLSMGVPQTWIFDLEAKKASVYSKAGLHDWDQSVPMQCGAISLEAAGLFAEEE